jgi:hypothetical protein
MRERIITMGRQSTRAVMAAIRGFLSMVFVSIPGLCWILV